MPDLSPELLEKLNIDRHKLGFIRCGVEVLMSIEKQNPTQGGQPAGEEEKKEALDQLQPDSSVSQ